MHLLVILLQQLLGMLHGAKQVPQPEVVRKRQPESPGSKTRGSDASAIVAWEETCWNETSWEYAWQVAECVTLVSDGWLTLCPALALPGWGQPVHGSPPPRAQSAGGSDAPSRFAAGHPRRRR